MKKPISHILKEASEKSPKEKIKFLRENDHMVLRAILQCAYNPNIKFLLPEDDPKYKSSPDSIGYEKLYSETRKIYLFIEGGNPNLKQSRREELFIQFLEAIHPDDAEMMLKVRKKQLPYKGLSEKVIREAFPDLLPEKKEEEVKTNVENT